VSTEEINKKVLTLSATEGTDSTQAY